MANPTNTYKFRSLTVTLALAFLALSMCILFISSGFGLFFFYKTDIASVKEEQLTAAQGAARTVSDFMEQKIKVLDQAADLNSLATSDERRDLVLNKLLGRDPSIRQLELLDFSGQRLYRVSRVSNISSGTLETASSTMLAAVARGDSYISPVYIDPITSEPLIVIAVPARDSFRDPKAAFIAEVNLKFMWDLVSNIQIGESGYVYVVDERGTLIAFRDVSRVLAHENLSSSDTISRFKAESPKTDGVLSDGILGRRVAASYVKLARPEWSVIVEDPIAEAYADLIRTIEFDAVILVIGSIISVGIGMYLSRRITREIIVLDHAAGEISAGNLNTVIKVRSRNEIGHLAASLNIMTEKLRDLYQNLEQKVGEKTTQLSSQVEETNKTKLAVLNLLEDVEAEKQKAEEMVIERTRELSEEKARLLASINSLSFGFVIVDRENSILIKNPALRRILDSADEPRTLGDIAAHLQGIDLLSFCKDSTAENSVVEHKDVSYGKKYLRVTCAPVTEGAVVIGNVILIEDITEAKVMERSRDEFFAVASHELRTPLTAIRGNADMILEMYADKIVDKDMKEMLTDINSSSVRLIDVVNDFLEVSRLEQGKIDIKKESFDVSDVAAKVVRDLKEMIGKKGLALQYAPPASPLPPVLADKNKVEQILVNLVGNSAKFTKTGSITIELSLEQKFVRVRIIDTGVGISEHNQTLLFRKFQQAGEDMLARDVSQSTGLGLYICRLIVNNMGGEIGLERSELGKGSVFFFTVPLA